jgi:hypothetical protein
MNTTTKLQVTFAPTNGQTSWTKPIAARDATPPPGARVSARFTSRRSTTVGIVRLAKRTPGSGENGSLHRDRFARRRFHALNHALERLSP